MIWLLGKLESLLGLLKKVPLWVWALLALLVMIYLYGEATRRSGKAEIQSLWDRDKARAAVELSRAVAASGRITTKIEYATREIVKTIYIKGDTRETVREVFVPTDSGYLSGGFRLYYDAAATNTVPDSTQITNAAPVAVTDVAKTTNANFTLCHEAYAKVGQWQAWATEQCAKNQNGCPDGDQ